MALLISGFEGLGDADFDVYRQVCWSSNLHNLDRMKTKARVVALAERVRGVVDDDELVVGSSSEIPSVWNGRQVRDQWAFLMRSEAARRLLQPVMARSTDLATKVKDPAEHHRHVLLAVRVDHEGIEVGLRMHMHATVDLANLVGCVGSQPGRLDEVLAGLDGMVLSDGRPVTSAGLIADVRAARRGELEWVLVAVKLPRAEAIAAGVELANLVALAAHALAPLYQLAAWTPDNDHVGVQQQVEALAEEGVHIREAQEAEREAAAEGREQRRSEARERTEAQVAELRAWKAGLRARREDQQADRAVLEGEARRRWDDQQAERTARDEEARQQRLVHEAENAAREAERTADLAARVARARQDAQEAIRAAEARRAQAQAAPKAAPREPRPERPARPEGAAAPRPGPRQEPRPGPRPEARPEARQEPRPEARPEPRQEARPEAASRHLEVGARCQLSRGLLAGKEGVVRSVDMKKGYYQVRVGVLDVNIAFADVSGIS